MRNVVLKTLIGSALALSYTSSSLAGEKFVFMTNWYAQAEHGGFYQALAEKRYQKNGLDVEIKMGGPQVNAAQIMAAGQADCILGSTDIQMLQMREGGLPIVNVAAFFQKDPSVIIAHDDVQKLEDLKDKTLLIAPQSGRSFWPWLKTTYGFTDAQKRPYTYNIQPFMIDKQTAQQGYLTSEPYAIQKAGGKSKVFLLSDHGFPAYGNTITCMESTVAKRKPVLEAFIRASAEGWKDYLANPTPGNSLIKKDNPNMTDEQLAYSVAKLNEMQLVTGGDAKQQGIGVITAARAKASYDFLVTANLLDPAKMPLAGAYLPEMSNAAKVMP